MIVYVENFLINVDLNDKLITFSIELSDEKSLCPKKEEGLLFEINSNIVRPSSKSIKKL